MEVKSDNSMLIAVSLIERARALTKEGTRVQLNRQTLDVIDNTLCQALSKLHNLDEGLVTKIISLSEFIKTLLEDPEYIDTDTETKLLIASKLNDIQDDIYVFSGVYYETHDFNYMPKMDSLLMRIVDHCIDKGIYFGLDEEIRGQSVSEN